MPKPYDVVKKKVNLKKLLEEGAIVLERAYAVRICVCGSDIQGGEKHLAIYTPNGVFSAKRHNFCRQCSGKLIRMATQRLFSFEKRIFGNGGA